MSSKHKKLGTLADIFQAESLDGSITRLRVDKIRPSEEQPRQNRKHNVNELAESIRTDGLLSPIVVTRDGDGYRIIAGERRYHAISQLGWKDVECRIISREERDYYRIAIIENLQRENLTAEEEADAMLKLKEQEGYSDAELASIVGKSRNYITEILSIHQLPGHALEACRNAGIENKNFLIQAVQAYKKNRFDEFIGAVKSGEVKTVKSAKEFNSTGKGAHTPSDDRQQGQSDPSVEKETRSSDSNGQVALKRKGSEIKISFPDINTARKAEKWLNSHINDIS